MMGLMIFLVLQVTVRSLQIFLPVKVRLGGSLGCVVLFQMCNKYSMVFFLKMLS